MSTAPSSALSVQEETFDRRFKAVKFSEAGTPREAQRIVCPLKNACVHTYNLYSGFLGKGQAGGLDGKKEVNGKVLAIKAD